MTKLKKIPLILSILSIITFFSPLNAEIKVIIRKDARKLSRYDDVLMTIMYLYREILRRNRFVS